MSDRAMKLLDRVYKSIDALIAAAEPYQGLMPSMLDRKTGKMLMDIPPGIPGQREHDRSIRGSNLIHDEPTLLTMLAMGAVKPEYALAAEKYLARFASHCTVAPTGLFPWGEHAYWHLVKDAVGNSYRESSVRDKDTTHDQLRAVPLWLWKKIAAVNPDCVVKYGSGLRGHWLPQIGEIPVEYTRHAYLDHNTPYQVGHRTDSFDFPRHGGFYIFNWAFAYTLRQEQFLLDEIRKMLDYWWNKRRPDGLLLIQSRASETNQMGGACGVAQTISLACSLLEAADLLDGLQPGLAPELAKEMRERARVYIDGFFAAPHDLESGKFLLLWHPTNEARTRLSPIWGSKYGQTPASYTAGTCLAVYRLTGDMRLLKWARAVGQGYLREEMPTGVIAPAMDAGMGLGLLADLYEITREEAWLTGAMELADRVVEIYFDELPLPRGASGIEWYESQMGPGFLLHGLARVALLSQDADNCPLRPDYTGR